MLLYKNEQAVFCRSLYRNGLVSYGCANVNSNKVTNQNLFLWVFSKVKTEGCRIGPVSTEHFFARQGSESSGSMQPDLEFTEEHPVSCTFPISKRKVWGNPGYDDRVWIWQSSYWSFAQHLVRLRVRRLLRPLLQLICTVAITYKWGHLFQVLPGMQMFQILSPAWAIPTACAQTQGSLSITCLFKST